MNEIEVKAKIDNIEEIKIKLQELGCVFNEPITQNDVIFVSKNQTPKTALRIREQENKIIFTLKQDRSNELDCIEREVEVSNKEQLHDIISLLGYTKYADVSKTRITAKYQNYTICLDAVSNLGTFIEVEKISDEDGQTIQQELWSFLESLGIKKENQILKGYDTLIAEGE